MIKSSVHATKQQQYYKVVMECYLQIIDLPNG